MHTLPSTRRESKHFRTGQRRETKFPDCAQVFRTFRTGGAIPVFRNLKVLACATGISKHRRARRHPGLVTDWFRNIRTGLERYDDEASKDPQT